MITTETNSVYVVKNLKTNKYIIEYDRGYMTSGICSTREQAIGIFNYLTRNGFDYHDLAITQLA